MMPGTLPVADDRRIKSRGISQGASAKTHQVKGREGWGIAVEWTFGTFLWWLLVFFFWFTVIWMFIAIFADILRRDMSGWAKAGWIILIVLLPFLGALIYLIARPSGASRDSQFIPRYPDVTNGTRSIGPADEIATAAQLYDEGKLTAEEFEILKQQALSRL